VGAGVVWTNPPVGPAVVGVPVSPAELLGAGVPPIGLTGVAPELTFGAAVLVPDGAGVAVDNVPVGFRSIESLLWS
jgi:hypothetical protein